MGWQLLTAHSRGIMPSRWQAFWNYVIRGKIPQYTVEAWVSTDKQGVSNVKIYIGWRENTPINGHVWKKLPSGLFYIEEAKQDDHRI